MLDERLYREELLEKLSETKNQEEIKDPDFQAELSNPLCGDKVMLQLKVKKGIIEEIAYSASGCALSQLSAGFLAEKIKGKEIDKIKIAASEITDWLGGEVGPSRMKCCLLSLQVFEKIRKET